MKFLNWELKCVGYLVMLWLCVIDMLELVWLCFFGVQNLLDVLCCRFCIDNLNWMLYGVFLDSELFVEVYLVLCGGRQLGLVFEVVGGFGDGMGDGFSGVVLCGLRLCLFVFCIFEVEVEVYVVFVVKLGEYVVWFCYMLW